MKIPIFVSCPTDLSPDQEAARTLILTEMDKYGFEARAIGRSDYPTDSPLDEVLSLARHCAGGVILGFSQLHVAAGTKKVGTAKADAVTNMEIPTAWNHLEAGILYALRIPLIIFREKDISGGVFDPGTGNFFVQRMPDPNNPGRVTDLQQILLRWQSRVRERYYQG
jgi:hypothetical protein